MSMSEVKSVQTKKSTNVAMLPTRKRVETDRPSSWWKVLFSCTTSAVSDVMEHDVNHQVLMNPLQSLIAITIANFVE